MHSNEILSISLLQFFQSRVVTGSWLPGKIAAYWLISACYSAAISLQMSFLNEISLDWRLRSTTQLSTSKLSDNPAKACLLRAIVICDSVHVFALSL